ncbi:MAG: DUF2142 domain-containing protein [Thermoanaerobaculia bacterium]
MRPRTMLGILSLTLGREKNTDLHGRTTTDTEGRDGTAPSGSPRLLARPDRFVAVAGLVFGAILLFLTPPFQVPDEPAHFFRAYLVSEGGFQLLPVSHSQGAELPASLLAVVETAMGGIHGDPLPAGTVRKAWRIPLAPDRREPVFFPNTLQYTFLPYLPQALAMTPGRLLGAPPLALLYLARLANLLFGVLAIAFAVGRLPAYRWLAALLALLPMTLFLLASASADVTSIAAGFVLAGTGARLIWGPEGTARRSDLVLFTLSTAVLCASKAVYLPLALLVILIPAPRRRAAFLALHMAVCTLAAAWFLLRARQVEGARIGAGVDMGRQIHDALAQPPRFLGLVLRDYAEHAPRYGAQWMGNLGWLDTPLPIPLLAAFLAALVALLLLDTGGEIRVSRWQRAVLAAAALGCLTLVSAAEYAIWTAYGADFIEGVQGRYFIPLVPSAAWMFHGRRWTGRVSYERLGAALAAFSLVAFGIVVWVVARRYYGV